MNTSEIFRFEAIRSNLQRSLEVLEGLCPAGSPPASGCQTRGAGLETSAVTNSDTASPLPDQGWGALRLLVARWKGEEATLRKSVGVFMQFGETDQAAYSTAEADGLKDRISEVENALRSDLRTQSVADGAQGECGLCGQSHYEGVENECHRKDCEFKERNRLKRKERSVSGNARVLLPGTPEKSEL